MELIVKIVFLCSLVSVINGGILGSRQPSGRPAHCEGIQCGIPNCPDYYLQEGDCCPSCPGPGRNCTYRGRTLRDGEKYKPDCNTCTCNDGKVACTMMACPERPERPAHCEGIQCFPPDCPDYYLQEGECCPGCPGPGRSCTYQGRTLRDGEKFKQDCNMCVCNDGNVACTQVACSGTKPGKCPAVLPIGDCAQIDRCTSDDGCPRRQKCCDNGCGRSCERPVQGKRCRYLGGTYRDGESFRDDCNVCVCNDGNVVCTRMACLKTCEHNGKRYRDGESFMNECNTCVCSNGQSICTLMACPGRPGQCSKIGSAVGSICREECTNDYSCPPGQKCCSTGCGRICSKPIGGGGGRQCVHNGKTYQDGETFKDECNSCVCNDGNAACTLKACTGRPGTCPAIINILAEICTDECTSDYSCPAGQKCCRHSCGRVCTRPVSEGKPCVYNGTIHKDGDSFKIECNTCTCTNGMTACTLMACVGKPGTCPRNTSNMNGEVLMCVDDCTSDYDCVGDDKCCGVGKCKLCRTPIGGGGGKVCVHRGKTYQDGETFKDDCNTCRCNNGFASCTRMACTGRPGTCPQPRQRETFGIAVCIDDCNGDMDCQYGQKCCDSGCGRVCMNAAGGGGTPCIHKGIKYPDGVSFKDECNTCNCRNGIAGCTRMACLGKPGTCPRVMGNTNLASDVCINDCTSDYDCLGDDKCCTIGNCKSCKTPIGGGGGNPCVHRGKTYQDGETFKDDCNTCRCNNGFASCTRMACTDRPGTCPQLKTRDRFGVCVDECYADTECQYGQKCCDSGCGRVCMNATGGGGRPCVHNGLTYPDGVNFKDECNTCKCRDGRAACTRMACPGKSGTCPRIMGNTNLAVDMCVNDCTSDYDCPGDEKCCTVGSCKSCRRPVGGGGGNRPCVYNGITYRDGESFKDQCNDCVCNDGNAACTMKACPEVKPGLCPTDYIGGACVNRCTTDLSCPGKEKCCSNGCGTLCLPPTMGGRPCYHNGQTVNDGDTYMDDCNTCTCNDGKAACTLMACPKKFCMYNGRMYQDGETFKQDCNTCTCNNGEAACTKMACYDEKPGHCPKPNGTGFCIVRCTTDLSCPREQKCCSNGCGAVCTDPVFTGGSCLHNGVVYKDDQTFKDDCNTCTCSGGNVICTEMACPRDKPGICPATPVINNSSAGPANLCSNECTDDTGCPDVQKCCSDGYCKVCMRPDKGGQPCNVNGYTFQHGESFKDGCNTCMCKNGKPACTKKACPPMLPCYHNGKMYLNGENFTDDCNRCVCRDGNVACTYKQCGPTCTHNGNTYKDGEAFKDDCNTCQCNDGKVTCTLLDCSGAKPGTCPRPQLFRPCNNRCVNDKGCQGTKKCCNNWCGHTCMEPVGKDNCQGIQCPQMECNLPNTLYTIPGTCCPICRPPLGEKPGSCPRIPRAWLCLDLCSADFHCPGQQKCCSHSCGKSCVRPRFDRCDGIQCPPLRCVVQFRPPGRCCPICRRQRGREGREGREERRRERI